MNENTIHLIQQIAVELYEHDHRKGYLLYTLNHGGGKAHLEIDYETAEKLNIGDTHMRYSIDLRVPCKENCVTSYKVIDKIIDEKDNILLIVDELKNIKVKKSS